MRPFIGILPGKESMAKRFICGFVERGESQRPTGLEGDLISDIGIENLLINVTQRSMTDVKWDIGRWTS
jgi:hypothetical protein